MAFEAGRTKTGGRVKGAPKKPRVGTMREIILKQGISLGKEIERLLRHPDASISDQIKMIQLLIQYTQVQPSTEEPVELEACEDDSKELSNEELGNSLKIV